METETSLAVVFLYGLITALATGLGALPLIFRKQAAPLLGTGQVVAAALMTCASVQLLNEARHYDYLLTGLGLVAGALLIWLTDKLIDRLPDLTQFIESDNAAGAREGFLIIFVMTIHSAAEGVGIGVSFGGGESLGALISITIALHNVPEGLAIALITVPRGMSVWKAGLWSVGSSLPQPVIGVLAFLFVTIFAPVLPFGLGLAAGAMFWMVGGELLPEARKSRSVVQIVVVFSVASLLFFALLAVL